MPSHQRPQESLSDQLKRLISERDYYRHYNEQANMALSESNKKLNKILSERDRLRHLLDDANVKLSEMHRKQEGLEDLLLVQKEQGAKIKKELAKAQRASEDKTNGLYDKYTTVDRKHTHLASQNKAAIASDHSHSPTKPKNNKEHKEERARKADKERLSQRFEERPPAPRVRRASYAVAPAPEAALPLHTCHNYPVAHTKLVLDDLYGPPIGLSYDDFEDGDYRRHPVPRF